MRNLLLLVCLHLFYIESFSQKVVYNILLNDVDEYSSINLLAAKSGFRLLSSYRGVDSVFDINKSIHYAQQKFDSSGRRIELVKGDNLSLSQISFIISYKKVSDSVYETITRYPKDSKAIPDDFFIDSVINKRATRFCLFGNDKDNFVYVRSVYYAKNPRYLKILRFDVKNTLKMAYYPHLNKAPNKESRDSALNAMGKIVFIHRTYEAIEQVGMDMYDKNNRVLETSYLDKDVDTYEETGNRSFFAYNHQGNVIMKITTGLNGELFSEERNYFKDTVLVRYTRDNDMTDDDVNEEYLYDEKGQLKSLRYKESHSSNETIWKFHRNNNGIPERDDLFKNGQYQLSKFYQYR